MVLLNFFLPVQYDCGGKMTELKHESEQQTILIQNTFNHKSGLGDNQRTPSNFNLPPELAEILYRKIGIAARIDQYLNRLLNKYRILCYSSALRKYSGSKLKYQDRSEYWERASFRPFTADWVELRILSSMHGMTMNKFFVMLVEIDLTEFGDKMDNAMNGLDPGTILRRPIVYKQSLCRNNTQTITKQIRFAEPVHKIYLLRVRDPRSQRQRVGKRTPTEPNSGY